VEHVSRSVKDTERIAAELARSFQGGECVALSGNLGAGKTQFVRGVVRALGANPKSVSSPTFVLLNVYPGGRLTVYHLDAYRVTGAEDFDAIGFPELLEQGGVVLVEWASKVNALLPASTIHVSIEPLDQTTRNIQIQLPTAPD
jgi:tRNA threonylcarbamoyladenosine biosynthesis protein TsaE